VKRSAVIEESTPPYIEGIWAACCATVAVNSVIDVFMARTSF
jgi:hypothetical protein